MAVGGLRLSQTYRAYGLLTSGAGAAVLYLSVYAGLNLYFLFGPTLAFTLLVVITAAVAWVAARPTSSSTRISRWPVPEPRGRAAVVFGPSSGVSCHPRRSRSSRNTVESTFCAATVPSHDSGGARQVSQLPHGLPCCPK